MGNIWYIYEFSSKMALRWKPELLTLKSNAKKTLCVWVRINHDGLINYENLDKGVYEYTNAISDISQNELDKGFAFPSVRFSINWLQR